MTIKRFRAGPLQLLAAGLMTFTSLAGAQDAPFKNLAACKDGAFSTEEDFMMMRGEPFDGNPYISDGDVLSPNGQVCARNAELLRRFDVKEDLGLDALDILSFEPGLVVFSTELESPHGTFSSGDILITNGAIIPNRALVAPFGIRHDIGLDEVKFMGKIENILKFVDAARNVKRDDWQGGRLQSMLKEFDVDIWFSIEGTKWGTQRPILDGDLLSASGSVIATNRELLAPGAPAGLPADGVDFGLDAFAVAREAVRRAREPLDIFFSSEILHGGKVSFTDGDVLRRGGGVAIPHMALIAAFKPAAKFLGLDALWFPFGSPPNDPRITTMCDLSVGQFDGGIVSVGGTGTGLHQSPLGSPPELIDTLERPCGAYVPVDGTLPVPPVTVKRFRVVYREHTELVPAAVGDPATPAIQTTWQLKKGMWKWVPMIGLQWVCESPAVLSTDANGWMDASDYIDAKNGLGSYIGCPNPELRLAVWKTQALPAGTPAGDEIPGLLDREDHYVLWLEWEDAGAVMHRELVDHHVQLDNTLPVIAAYPNGLQLRMTDGKTVIPACGEAPVGASQFQVWGQFDDKYYHRFSVGLKGGLPPASVSYGPQYFYNPTDGTMGVKNTDPTGTTPDATTVHLRDIAMTDLGASFNKCCYLLEIYVSDRAIRHTFDGTFVNNFTGTDYSYAFITFSAQP
jgi:hypothetical protein